MDVKVSQYGLNAPQIATFSNHDGCGGMSRETMNSALFLDSGFLFVAWEHPQNFFRNPAVTVIRYEHRISIQLRPYLESITAELTPV
jgi:hypothetical protein